MATEETKIRILDVAERMFGARGFQGTSMRQVTAEADVNLAAVHYHFGSKEALLRATLARRVEPANRERLKRLEQIEAAAGNGAPPLEVVLEAFLEPVLEIGRESPEERTRLRQLAGRIHAEPPEIIRPLLYEVFGDVARRFLAALCRALPDLPAKEVALRFQFAIGVFIQVISEQPTFEPFPEIPPDDEVVLREMVAFLAAGFRAPRANRRSRRRTKGNGQP
jgi:AcrR family transcriptional regulator